MTVAITCSKCGEQKLAQDKYFELNLKKYNCNNLEELSSKYMCRKCIVPIRKAQKKIDKKNRLLNDNLSNNEFTKLGRFIYCRVSIQMQVNKLKKAGLNDEIARTVFMSSVKNILDKAGFLDYHLVIESGILKGIMLKKIPLYGEVLMKLEG